ncbi:poly 1 [Fusarium longipes]|uniref:Poly 1 n=1 Tax=Fusarium longipes TaxID=694270 RepID=A0A395SJA6_9HYPO|nr:poly 1 [Fusarium longipes]
MSDPTVNTLPAPPAYVEVEPEPPAYTPEVLESATKYVMGGCVLGLLTTQQLITDFIRQVASEEHTNQTITCDMFNTSARVKGNPEAKWLKFGVLELGLKRPMGVLHQYGAYLPHPAPAEDGGDEDDETEFVEISACLSVIDDQGESARLHYYKDPDPILTPYSFDIIVEPTAKGPTFMGSITIENVEYEFKGRFWMQAQKVIQVTKAPEIPTPEKLEGTLNEFLTITPFAYKDEGMVKQGQDGAQVLGDDMWQRISMHAISPEMKEKVLKNLQPLSDPEKKLLEKYVLFFKHYAVHDLAEKLKRVPDIPDRLRKHIQWKRYWFLKMMTSYAAPPPEANEPDPVVQYGWDRKNNKDELKALQDQYLGLTMECYEMGYVTFCQPWITFLKEPYYWYKVYASYLESKEHIEGWAKKLPSRSNDKGKMSVSVEIMHWSNKLNLLKHAVARTDPEKAKSLNVDDTVDKLTTALNMSFTLAQVLGGELSKHILQIMEDLDKQGEGFSQYYQHMSQEHQKLVSDMKTNGFAFILRAADPNNTFHSIVRKKTRAYSPAVPTPNKLVPAKIELTFGHVLYALDNIKADHDFKVHEANIKKLPLDQLERDFEGLWGLTGVFEEKVAKTSCKDWVKGLKTSAVEALEELKDNVKKISWWGKIAKGILFGAATALMAVELMRNYKNMNPLSVWMSSLQLGCIAADMLAGKVGRWLLTKLYSVWDWGRKMTGKVVAWLSNTVIDQGASLAKRFAHAFVGSLYKVIRLVGLACTVLGLINTQNELEKAKEMSDNDARIYNIFNRIQFWLGIVEAVALVAEIGFEVAGMATAANMCGALGAVAGILGVIAIVVYLVAFQPDPWAFAEKWLKEDGKEYKAYDEDKEFTPESEPVPTVIGDLQLAVKGTVIVT